MLKTALLSKVILTTAGAAALAISVLPGVAQAGRINNRLNHEQARINRGVQSGQLTRREYSADEARLERDENLRNRDLKSNGGKLTPSEREQLNNRLNRNSRDVYFTKHNRADQPRV